MRPFVRTLAQNGRRQNYTVTLKMASANYETKPETNTVHTLQQLCTGYTHQVRQILFHLTMYFFKRNSLAVALKIFAVLIILIEGSNELQTIAPLSCILERKLSIRQF